MTPDPQADPAILVRAGGWLFRQRTWIPAPLVAALLIIPVEPSASMRPVLLGVAMVALGEALRLWAVRHIGSISRTRGDRLGPLVETGPFAIVRNPLYLGNMALWTGMALAARLTWLAPIFILVLAVEYSAIVSWEEHVLTERRGAEYRDYASRVPRWLPAIRSRRPQEGKGATGAAAPQASFSWSDTLFSERGTLIAIAAGFLLLWLKSRPPVGSILHSALL